MTNGGNHMRTLDYVARLVDANRAYRITAADPTLLQRSRYWVPGVVLDQQAEGSCVGHGVVGEYLASPVRGDLREEFGSTSLGRPVLGHNLAWQVYGRAKEIDEFEGIDYDGTSVRAGMLVARERGWITGFRWAFSMLELRAALEEGPVVVGVEWREGMYTPLDDILVPTGPIAGGHCLLVTGYSPNKRRSGPHYRLRNSWSPEWGRNGSAYIAAEDLDYILFRAGGEAAVPTGRAL